MSQGTVITITNLSDEIGALLGGVTSVVLDVPTDFSIRLSKSVEQLSILNKISTEAALGFSVPFTPTNDRVFSEYATPLTLNVTIVFFQCQVIVDGHPLQFSRLFVRRKNERNREWELELARNPDHWVELSSQVTTNQLDFGTFQMTKTNIVNSWPDAAYEGDYKDLSGGLPIYWPLVDYGGWVDQTQPPQNAPNNRVKAVGVEDFRPWLSWIYILQAGFCKFGWTLESVLFESDVAKKLWVYALRQDYFIASENQLGGRVTGGTYTRTRVNQGEFFLLEEVDVLVDYAVIDNTNFPVIRRYCGVKNYPGVSLQYRFFFKGEFHNDRTLPFTAFFSVMEIENSGSFGYIFTGEVISTESLEVQFAPGEKKSVTFDQTVTLKPGQMGAIHIPVLPQSTPGFFMESGFYFSVTPANDSYMTDDIIDVRLSVSDDMTILDWLKAFIHVSHGKLQTDWETKTVTIFPNKTSDVWGDMAPGFLLREDPVIDIADRVQPNSVILNPVRPDLKRFTRFMFKSSSDAYIKSLNLLEPPHSRKLLNSVDLPNAVEPVENPFIEPTIEGKMTLIGSGAGGRSPLPYLPRLWDNTDGQRSFAIAPRVLYAYGAVRQENPAPINATNQFTSFFFDKAPNPSNTGLVNNFGYATQSPTWAINPTPPVVVDFVFGVKARDLFTTFYLGYTQDNRSGNVADLLLLMSMSNYQEWNFRQLFRFYVRGLPVIAPMISIRDFSSAEKITTPVQFFVEPAVLDCCDLPCGCQFIECEYYQDMSPMMRQSTLDDWRISSFVVDGVELIVTPVSFGKIKVIDVGGQPYVTNLVDTFNSIGAPYFSFNYSTRSTPSKGLRFFKIKHLACIEFRILITVSGSDGYEYTHDSQGQAVFQSGFDALGYAGDLHDEPENCLTTTEY